MPRRKTLPPVTAPRKKAPVVKLVTRPDAVSTWGPYCLWPRRDTRPVTLPVIRIERV
jgi:hypothetical protein